MHPNFKTLVPILPVDGLASNATQTASVDTLGYDYCTIELIYGPNDDVQGPAHYWVKENTSASTTNAATWTGNTTTNPTITVTAAGNTAWGAACKHCIDLRARKRYMVISHTPSTNGTVDLCVVAHLFHGQEEPVGTTEENCGCVVEC